MLTYPIFIEKNTFLQKNWELIFLICDRNQKVKQKRSEKYYEKLDFNYFCKINYINITKYNVYLVSKG